LVTEFGVNETYWCEQPHYWTFNIEGTQRRLMSWRRLGRYSYQSVWWFSVGEKKWNWTRINITFCLLHNCLRDHLTNVERSIFRTDLHRASISTVDETAPMKFLFLGVMLKTIPRTVKKLRLKNDHVDASFDFVLFLHCWLKTVNRGEPRTNDSTHLYNIAISSSKKEKCYS